MNISVVNYNHIKRYIFERIEIASELSHKAQILNVYTQFLNQKQCKSFDKAIFIEWLQGLCEAIRIDFEDETIKRKLSEWKVSYNASDYIQKYYGMITEVFEELLKRSLNRDAIL